MQLMPLSANVTLRFSTPPFNRETTQQVLELFKLAVGWPTPRPNVLGIFHHALRRLHPFSRFDLPFDTLGARIAARADFFAMAASSRSASRIPMAMRQRGHSPSTAQTSNSVPHSPHFRFSLMVALFRAEKASTSY
jgi:hypothetical protein